MTWGKIRGQCTFFMNSRIMAVNGRKGTRKEPWLSAADCSVTMGIRSGFTESHSVIRIRQGPLGALRRRAAL